MARPAKKEEEEETLPRFEFFTDEELESLPPPTWLIDKLLVRGRLALLYGEPGGGKTFVALSMAFAVASGRPWYGRPVTKGKVVFVAGEGIGGLPQRVKAWKRAFGVGGNVGVVVPKRPLNMMDGREIGGLIESVKELKPVLIIIDTLARAMVDGDEDSAKDMGRLVKGTDLLVNKTGATVLFLHHPVKSNSKTERGSGALRGAVDTALRLATVRGQLTLSCVKQKDAQAFDDIHLKLVEVALDEGSSCVVELADSAAMVAGPNERESQLLDLLATFPAGSARYSDWQQRSGIPERTFNRIRGSLLEAGYVEQASTHGPRRYQLTDKGRAATANSLPTDRHGSNSPSTATNFSPLYKGGSGSDSDSLNHLDDGPLSDP